MISMGTDNHLARRKPVPMPTVAAAELPTTAPEAPARGDAPPPIDVTDRNRAPAGPTTPATTARTTAAGAAPGLRLTADDLSASARVLATGVLFGAGAVFGVGAVVGAATTRRLRRRLGPKG